ncbi:hypothetical protein BDB00DRAFT_868230 [Zychaea mexicana]|uniref:uncharacterized protein n=1 Tax=Zychaea mexicana TaxID=64656 RepID=UPI0022FE219A|nr:uncharacterized protein BDB00DRAFT_868230 [Zychaea mexicana]KAI9497631.1 hypothetical protein BDB00DRAFT_868230 [Zychaea mexicana]
MARRSSYTQPSQTVQNCQQQQQQQPNQRRVSFDLDHNVVHILPSLDQCRQEASRRGREEWERKQFNQDMLCELIVAEIQQQYHSASSSSSSSSDEDEHLVLKSCLKKIAPNEQETLSTAAGNNKRKNSKKSNGKKKGKRGHANNHKGPAAALHQSHAAPGCTMAAQAKAVAQQHQQEVAVEEGSGKTADESHHQDMTMPSPPTRFKKKEKRKSK